MTMTFADSLAQPATGLPSNPLVPTIWRNACCCHGSTSSRPRPARPRGRRRGAPLRPARRGRCRCTATITCARPASSTAPSFSAARSAPAKPTCPAAGSRNDLTAVVRILIAATARCWTAWKPGWRGWPPRRATLPLAEPQHPRRQPPQHRRALRSRQRLLPAVPRRDPDVLLRPVRAPGQTLAEAQRAKLDRICRKLALGPRDHVLEIGTGWGGFALHAATPYGCRVTTTTISREQYELAHGARRARPAWPSASTVLLEDYRDLRGQLRQAGLDRDDRGGRPRVSTTTFFRQLRRAAEARRR